MRLFGANDVLRLVTTSAANLDVVAAHATTDGATTGQGATRTKISSATTTTIVAAPGTDLERTVFAATIRNRHASLANTVAVEIFDGTNAFEIAKVTLAAGEQLVYDGLHSWSYLNAQGLPKMSQSQGSSGAALNAVNLVVLSADVTNNNATLNTMQDVTGLSFPGVAGETYQFEFFIDYTAAATTTGSRWGLNGPSFSRLIVDGTWTLTASTKTLSDVNAYDQPAAANASSLVAGNLAYLCGFITPSVDGNIIARFASEIAASAIVAKKGSLLKWTRTA